MTPSRQFYISSFQSDLLDLFRWVAAFLVVTEHLRSLLFADYDSAGKLRITAKILYFLTGFGHSAVMIFFVMSGFLVGGKVLERLFFGNFSFQKYAVDRLGRLYAVYLVALLLGGTLDYLGYHHFNQFGLYNQSFTGRIAVVNHNYHQALTVPIFFTNLAMCQTILGPVFGSNGPLWSLANEFWYYVAGPLVFLLIFTKKTSRLIFVIIVLAGIIWFLPAPILIYAVVWLLGAALYFVNGRRLVPIWMALGLFAVCFNIARMQWLDVPYLADFLIAISFALVINSAAGISHRLPGNRLNRQAADFSYSIYLCHFPFLVFVISILFQLGFLGFPGRPTLKLMLVFIIVLLLAYVWCYLISLATERQTSRIRALLNRFLMPKKQSNPVP